MYPSSIEGHDIIRTTKKNGFYKTNYARLCPFLLAQGRRHMSKILYEHRDHVYRLQTDGFLIDKLIHENIDVGLGGLKYEGFNENAIILNCINKVETHY